MTSLKCEQCNGEMELSADRAMGTCAYCGSKVQLAAPQANAPNASDVRGDGMYKLILLNCGAEKIKVIKVLRDITAHLGLAEAKNAAEQTPSLISNGPDRELLELEKMQLEEAGAMVQILSPGDPIQVNYAAKPNPPASPSPAAGGKSGGCYVATAVYGSYDCPEVWVLRRFRDDVLAVTWYGRLFIRLYYASSPAAVRRFGGAAWFSGLLRRPLDGLTRRLGQSGFSDAPYED
ncbi:MAG: ribosomal protein L7/L12 [Oscillospiraceae bacterium]|nr:ribosomal protein L7/L12 [Oscillospiraceae bacterium]